MSDPIKNVVLVHGGFVDGSGWRPVYDLLTQDGYHVAVVQNPPCRSRATPPRRG
jgi:pimeloyl-ACP methyl ester carboxylesterase